MSEAGPPLIEIDRLTKRFGPVLAVDQLSFAVEPGEVVGFLGANGAGKTTTLRMLLGLVRPDGGTATINGHAYADLPEPLHQVGAVLEASSFHPGRTKACSKPCATCSNSPGSPAPLTAGSAGSRSVCGSGSDWPPRCLPIRTC